MAKARAKAETAADTTMLLRPVRFPTPLIAEIEGEAAHSMLSRNFGAMVRELCVEALEARKRARARKR